MIQNFWQKGRKARKMEPRLSLQSLFTPSESEDVTQLANEYGGHKLHITVFVQAREFVIFLLNFKTKLLQGVSRKLPTFK